MTFYVDETRACLEALVSHHDAIVDALCAKRILASKNSDEVSQNYWNGKIGAVRQMREQAGRALATSAWRSLATPPVVPVGKSGIAVLAVIDDPRFRDTDGAGDTPFVDVVTYWNDGRWTVTLQCRRSDTVEDFPVRVTKWMHLPPIAGETAVALNNHLGHHKLSDRDGADL